jgi:hypothetical protein
MVQELRFSSSCGSAVLLLNMLAHEHSQLLLVQTLSIGVIDQCFPV